MQAADKTQSIKDEIKKGLGESCDISVKTCETVKGVCVYAYEDALINKETLFRDILPYLKSDGFDGDIHNFVACDCKSTKDIDSLCQGVLGGCLGLYFDEKYYLFSIQSWEKRSVTIPEAENVIRGPKEGFTEDLQTNISLIRRKIKNKNLILEKHIIGRQSNTSLCICYMNGIADPEIVKGITDKITAIDVDGVFDVGQIEQLIEEKPMHSVAGMGMTQKPDVCAMRVLEGRVAVILDGTPHVLTIPELFIENIHTAEDYYNRPYAGTMIRVFRIFAFIISILLPGAAVAIVNHSPELLPTDFLINLLASEERTPFPFGLEILLMMFLLMVLRESGTRLPKAIGSAVSIVGALIIGDAAIAAGIVGAQSVILIALAAVCSYLVPNLAEVSLIYRFSFVFLGLFFGLLGLGAGIVFFYAQMASQTSFGVPLSGLFKKSDYADTLIRFPLKKLKFRPSAIAHRNIKRSAM